MMTYVTGSASCGKSAEAERLCSLDGGRLVYLAAMRPFGEEGAQRVRKHRAQRAGKGFTTIECFDDFEAVLDDERIVGATALLECLGNVVANEMFGDAASRDGVADRIVDTIEELSRRCAHLVVVGNDVGCDGETYPSETRAYQEALGEVSCRLAALSDQVIECVAGVPVLIKVQ